LGLGALFKGGVGELKTKFLSSIFLKEDYQIFNDIIIQTSHGSTQIDHVGVSKYGLFVIETKDKTGWIFGTEEQANWTQVIFNKRYQFQNPLRQNYGHIKGLSEILGIEDNKLHSIVIFWGDCKFKNEMPVNVVKGGILKNEFQNYIKSKNSILLTQQQINGICEQLNLAKENSGFFSHVNHVVDLKEKYNSDSKCPKCQGTLVRKAANKGTKDEHAFLGCSNYSRYRYTKNIV
jgi:hypothetical protein